MTRILVTGSRDWTDVTRIRAEISRYATPEAVLVVGDCPTGADAIAASIWRSWPCRGVEVWTADWRCNGRAAGPLRNQAMVDTHPDFCVAFIRNGSKGATDCAARAEKAGIPTRLVLDDSHG